MHSSKGESILVRTCVLPEGKKREEYNSERTGTYMSAHTSVTYPCDLELCWFPPGERIVSHV